MSGRRRGGLLLGALLLMGAGPERAPRIHEVRPGETLSHIALYAFGDPMLWPAIYEANRDQIKDPSRVYPGQQLEIPEIDPDQVDAVRREALAHRAE